jgi:tetratricopeptide (TPR) repeat protein
MIGSTLTNVRAVAVLLMFVSVAQAQAQAGPEFARANDEFAKGNFPEAIRGYESLVKQRQWSAPLFYDLGNAYFRTGEFGRAILNYERARILDPQQPETTPNLALAREQARALELQRQRVETLLEHVPTGRLVIGAAVGFWVLAFAGVVAVFSRRRSSVQIALALSGALTLIVCAALTCQIENNRRNLAVVVEPDVRARVATADNAGTVLQLPPGSEVRVLSRRGDWAYAELPNNLRGWINAASIESVRL